MTLILPIALIEGVALLALAGYGFYQHSLSRMWKQHYGDAYSDNLRLTDARNQAQTDLARAKDEIATLEQERDNARANALDRDERIAALEAARARYKELFERAMSTEPRVISVPTSIITPLPIAADGTPPVEPTPGVRTIDTSAPAPVAAGSDGEPQYAVKKPRKRANGKATGDSPTTA